jgi:hypothetical protein
LIVADETERERVDERVQSIRIIESDFAADGRHAKGVAVVRDTRHDSGEERAIASPVARVFERAEAYGVHRRDGARAHREDVAKYSAHARRRALKRFDERRMIVRFDFEGRAPSVAHINDARVLARRHDDALVPRRQTLQVHARRFIRAVLRPHHREDAEFHKRQLASHQLDDARVFFPGQIVCGDNFGCDDFHKLNE